MKKLAIFVEGQTEQYFVVRLLTTMFASSDLDVHAVKALGPGPIGKYRARQMWVSKGATPKYKVLVVDSGGDKKVLGDISSNSVWLQDAKYDFVIGLRDVLPHERSSLKTSCCKHTEACSST